MREWRSSTGHGRSGREELGGNGDVVATLSERKTGKATDRVNSVAW